AKQRIDAIVVFLEQHPNHWEGPAWLTLFYVTVVKAGLHYFEIIPRWFATRKEAEDKIAAIDLATMNQYEETYSEILSLTSGSIRNWLMSIENVRIMIQKNNTERANDYLLTLKSSVEDHQKLYKQITTEKDDVKLLKQKILALGPRLKKYWLR
ncbi:MAG: hypothetical protein U1E10_07820, partial [Bdellovibrionales bacterium]|nr:hypothetical protein [Bdellovibrionales bacterium]